MKYEIGNMNLTDPATGEMLKAGTVHDLAEIRPYWTDADWLARAGLAFAVRPVGASAPVVEESADPLPVVGPPSEAQADDGEPTGEAVEVAVITYSAETLDAMDIAELKAIAKAIGLAFGGRSGAKSLRARILAFQAGA